MRQRRQLTADHLPAALFQARDVATQIDGSGAHQDLNREAQGIQKCREAGLQALFACIV